MSPYIVELGKFHIRWYSVFIVIGVLVSYISIKIKMKRFRASNEFVTNIIFWTIIFGIIGARAYYVAFNWKYYSQNLLEILQIWNGGIAIHGALIAGILTIILFCKQAYAKTLLTLDIIAPSVLFAQALGRWGNFFNQEAYGSMTTLEALKSYKIIPEFVIKGMYINGNYYLPMFYFESILCLIGVIVLIIISRFRYIRNGQQFGFYLVWYSLIRFFIEKYRTDSLMLGSFKIAQIVSVILFFVGLIIIVIQNNKPKLEELYNSSQKIENERFQVEKEGEQNV